MTILGHKSIREFLDHAEPCLIRAEAENTLILGFVHSLLDNPQSQQGRPLLITVDRENDVIGAALMTPPHKLLVTRLSETDTEALARHLAAADVVLPGVVGPSPSSQTFAECWTTETGQTCRLAMDQKLYRCDAVETPARSPGRFRPATPRDETLLVEWYRRFREEIGLEAEDLQRAVRRETAGGQLYVWEDGRAVSMVGWRGKTAHGVRLAPVYTPPDFRRKGYATSCVAALTDTLLDSGSQYCLLYTDAANPTSNGIYRRIGYRLIGDSQDWCFD